MDPTAKRNLLNFLLSTYPHMVQAFRAYEASVIATHRRKNQLQFLRDCLEEQVLPSSCAFLLRQSESGHPFPEFARLYLQDRILFSKRAVEDAFYTSRRRFGFLRARLPYHICLPMADVAHDTAKSSSVKHKISLSRKLRYLTSRTPWSRFSKTDAVLNISSTTLTPHQLELLGLGLSFALRPNSQSSIDIISAVTHFFRGEKHKQHLDFLRGVLVPALVAVAAPRHSLPRRYQRALQSLQASNLTILPSDKGNSVVVLDNTTYLEKANDLLADRRTYKKLRGNPRERIRDAFHKRLRQLDNTCPDANLHTRFHVINPLLPHFYGLPKTHKPNVPLRPIISSRGSVTHPLASWLAKSLTPLLGSFSPAHLQHTEDFISHVMGASPKTMLSLDVESLFTNVPLEEVLDFLHRKLEPEDTRLPLPTDIFLELIRLCVDSNSFSYNDHFYSQTYGVAMGSPLSPVLANLYMEYFESELLPSITLGPSLWLRYVDDVFALWPHDPEAFPGFLEALNSLSPSIRFKVEWEVDGKLPFLDALVHRTTSHFSFSVYRKPMHSGMYVHFFSHHSLHTKISVASSLFLRALRICDGQFLDTEIQHLQHSFGSLGYPTHVLKEALARARRTFYTPRPKDNTKLPVLCLPHLEELQSLQRPLLALNTKLAFRQTNTLRRSLVHTAPRSDRPTMGTYTIPCKECHLQYFGITGRSLKQRISEHKTYIKKGNTSSAIFCHLRDENHHMDWAASKVIFPSTSHHTRGLVESALIMTTPNINISKGFSKIEHIVAPFIMKQLKDFTHPSHVPPEQSSRS